MRFENGLIPLRISCFRAEDKDSTIKIFPSVTLCIFSIDKENSTTVENKNIPATRFIMHYETWSFPFRPWRYSKRIIFEKKKMGITCIEQARVFCPLFSRVIIKLAIRIIKLFRLHLYSITHTFFFLQSNNLTFSIAIFTDDSSNKYDIIIRI